MKVIGPAMLAAIFAVGLGAWAQDAAPPVPAQILSAKSAFLANGGESCTWFTGPDRAYRDLYTALQKWGRYKLAAGPGNADLVFNVSFACPAVAGTVINGVGTGPTYEPVLQLKILLPQTRTLLWTLQEPVQTAVLQSNRDKNFDQGIAALVADLQQMRASLPVQPTPPKLRQSRTPEVVALVVGAVAAVALYLVFQHKEHEMAAQPLPPLPNPQPPPFPIF